MVKRQPHHDKRVRRGPFLAMPKSVAVVRAGYWIGATRADCGTANGNASGSTSTRWVHQSGAGAVSTGNWSAGMTDPAVPEHDQQEPQPLRQTGAHANEAFRNQYARAREDQADAYADLGMEAAKASLKLSPRLRHTPRIRPPQVIERSPKIRPSAA
jgi:hypothetical protein